MAYNYMTTSLIARRTVDSGAPESTRGFIVAGIGIVFCLVYNILLPRIVNAQAIQWQQFIGGGEPMFERITSVIETNDHALVVVGATTLRGKSDMLIAKLYMDGRLIWQRMLGGDEDDSPSYIIQSNDAGYVVVGSTHSNDNNVPGSDLHGIRRHGHGGQDVWVIKLDTAGNLLWQNVFGGSGNDLGYAIIQARDGGYVIAGQTESPDGDIRGFHGDTTTSHIDTLTIGGTKIPALIAGSKWKDGWIVKIDSGGRIMWQRAIGGSNNDAVTSIVEMPDHDFIVAGFTASRDGDLLGQRGNRNDSTDGWVVKFNDGGNIRWQRLIGGSGKDEILSAARIDGAGVVLAGITESHDGDFSTQHGSVDGWIIKLDSQGKISWQKTIGGSKSDIFFSVARSRNGGFSAVGISNSNDGDCSGYHSSDNIPYPDAWIAKFTVNGRLEWQHLFGGTRDDAADCVIQVSDGSYLFAGTTSSADGDLRGSPIEGKTKSFTFAPNGAPLETDIGSFGRMWIVKLAAETKR